RRNLTFTVLLASVASLLCRESWFDRCWLVQIDPNGTLLRTLDRFINELHAAQSIIDGRIAALWLLTRFYTANIRNRHPVDIGECLVEALWMTGWRTGSCLRVITHIAETGAQNLLRLTMRFEEQRVRLHLMPFQTGPGAIDANAQGI